MCTGAEMSMAGAGLGAVSDLFQADTQRILAASEAEAGVDAARQQAEKILRATARQRGAARAATAASGARIDEFSLRAEQEIQEGGELDAAMTILGAERQGRAMMFEAKLQKAAALQSAGSTLFKTAVGKGWRNTKVPADGFQSEAWWAGGAGWEGE